MICEFFDDKLEYQENLLAKYYWRNGHEVTIVTSLITSVLDYVSDRAPKNKSAMTEMTAHAKIIRLPFQINILNRIRVFPKLDQLLEAENPDVIFVHDIIPNLLDASRYVKTRPNCSLILDCHADFSNSGKNWLSLRILHGLIRKWFLDRSRRYIDKIFPIVPATLEFLAGIYRVPPKEMELLPLGTDLEFGNLIRASKAGAKLRRSIGIPADAFIVFSGGKLSPLKGTEYLIDAVRAITDPRLRLLIAGKAEPRHEAYEAMLKARADGDNRILFRGWLDRSAVYAHLDASDVAVFPSSQSVLWQQSIGMRLPLIVSEKSPLARAPQSVAYLNRYDNVIVLKPDAPVTPQIVHHLQRLMADPSLCARMAHGAERTAVEVLDWNMLIERTLHFRRPNTH